MHAHHPIGYWLLYVNTHVQELFWVLFNPFFFVCLFVFLKSYCVPH